MTKEEIKKEAEKSWQNDSTVSGASMPSKIYIAGYLAGIGSSEKRIAELEAQIEEIKCCPNCKHFNYKEVGTGNKDCILWQAHNIFCKNKDKWELRG